MILTCTVWIWLPLTLLVMCMIKLTSPGPAFYRQRRIGYRGKQFLIFKFRTMRLHAETRTHEEYLEKLIVNDIPMTKLDAMDPRVIPGGRFLRAAGLDELPQIFNVLRGEMSLVGPRPCTVNKFQCYQPGHRDRVNAPPGITGFWQVNGKNRTTFREMIAMDIFYAKNMSLSLDLKIIWKTIFVVVRQAVELSAPVPRPKPSEQQNPRIRQCDSFGLRVFPPGFFEDFKLEVSSPLHTATAEQGFNGQAGRGEEPSGANVLRLIRIRLTAPSLDKITPRLVKTIRSGLRTADSSSINAVSFSSARTTKRFPSSRYASAIQIVRR